MASKPLLVAVAFVDGLLFDVRLALRGLRRDRAFTAAAIVMLASRSD